ncbi:MAG: hypothetical protein ACI97A_000952 [Planctomycetota bacterium]|jgi:hypothetical protein
MNNENDDLLNDLQSSWRTIKAPHFDDAENDSRNEETQKVVTVLRQAWSEIEAPTYTPQVAQKSPFRAWRQVGSVAAAAILVAMTIWSFSNSGGQKIDTPIQSKEVAEIPKQEAKVVDMTTTTTTPLERGGLLVKKGRVRLILVQPLAMDEPINLEDEK